MNIPILSAGIACVIAGIVGGGLKAFGVEIPALESVRRQATLALFGVVLILGSSTEKWVPFVSKIATSSSAKEDHPTEDPNSGKSTKVQPPAAPPGLKPPQPIAKTADLVPPTRISSKEVTPPNLEIADKWIGYANGGPNPKRTFFELMNLQIRHTSDPDTIVLKLIAQQSDRVVGDIARPKWKAVDGAELTLSRPKEHAPYQTFFPSEIDPKCSKSATASLSLQLSANGKTVIGDYRPPTYTASCEDRSPAEGFVLGREKDLCGRNFNFYCTDQKP